MSQAFDIGDRLTLTASFRDADGELADPSEVTLDVLSPDGTVTRIDVDSASTGVWTGTVDPDTSGRWVYRWVGTGAVVAAEEGSFSVRRRRVPEPSVPEP